ncbi:G-protein coupled receptor 161 isoform X2 [Dendroctonus ponderosae]|uniref:G-protein coupled receptor 161 isoform X2 n=1 Tax=Dendroctonus ponderosae TaxID=77166 RepID=UPI0020354F8A|nr:G-protein coupled receptor 161 isoform X2 [Dendroctonus ponderosae]
MTLILSVVLTIICTIGIAFNGYTVLVILLTRQVNTANNILLLHLGIINIFIGILFLIFCLPGIKGTEWASAGAPCAVNGFFFTLLHPLALWTICGLNCDRYYAIAAPLHYTHIVSTRKVLVGLFLGWINSILLAIPPLFNAAPYRYLSGLGACAPEFRTGIASVWYAAAYTGFTLLLPATVFICCNVKILIIARYHRHRIASAIFEVALSAQVTITHQRNPFFVPTVTAPAAGGPKLRGSNPILAVFLLVASFLLMCVPYYILVLYEAASYALNIGRTELVEVSNIHHFYMAAGTLLICSPAVNGYLYGLKNKSLRKAFMNYWRKKQTKNEVHHEIQARTPSTCGSRRPSLTPFGVFTRNPNVSRRMSETLIDVNKSLRSPRSKIKRNTSEVMWRPASDEAPSQSMKQTISCNTLRVPEEIQIGTEEELKTAGQKEEPFEPIPKIYSPSNLLLKIFKFDEKIIKKPHNSPPNDSDGSPKRSPRILITRAFSEESEKSSQGNSPHRDINRKLSNSASNLIEKKLRQIKYQDEETDSDCAKSNSTTKPLLGSCSLSNRSSESSETSGSSGKIYMNLDERRMSMDVADQESNEEQLLLTWNSHKRYHKPEDARRSQKSNIMKVTVQTKEIVL